MKKRVKREEIAPIDSSTGLPIMWVYEDGKRIRVTNRETLEALAEVQRRGIDSYKKYTLKEFLEEQRKILQDRFKE
jgi:uncharacterized protein (DUF4213/DUF364 family)